ncbi:MAG: hypothetical protein M1499_02215 [Firmicutes bacterium]|nr:hypothetical protein [Bacillota bacterium]
MARRKKPVVAGAESALDQLRRMVKAEVKPTPSPYRDRFLTLARKVADDVDEPVNAPPIHPDPE